MIKIKLSFIVIIFLVGKNWAFDSCPNTPSELVKLKSQLTQLKLIDVGLKDFIKGKVLQEKSLSTLFIVDLDDPEQIRRRLQDLRTFLDQKQAEVKCSNLESSKILLNFKKIEIEIARSRLNFLALPDKQRVALVALQKEAMRNKSEIEFLKKIGEKAEKKLEQINEAIKEAESLSLSSTSADMRELAAELTMIERTRKLIAEKTFRLTVQMESIGDEYQAQTRKLGEISSVLSRLDADISEVTKSYKEVAVKWRGIVDDVVSTDNLITQKVDFKLPKEKEHIVKKARLAGYDLEAKKYVESFSRARSELTALKELSEKLSSLKREQRYRELVVTGQIRSQLIRMIEDKGHMSPFRLSNEYITDIVREIKLVPYRPKALFISALNKVKETMSSGVEGIFELLKSIAVLSFFILIPVFSLFLLKRILFSIEESRRQALRTRNRRQPTTVLNWIIWARPYIPWVVMLLALNISKAVVQDTELDWLSEILPYFNFYFIYKLFRVFIDSNLFAINKISQNKLTKDLQARIEKTSKHLGLFFLLSAYLLETTATVARRALFYRVIWDLLFWLSPLVLASAAYLWRKEISSALKETLAPSVFEKIKSYLVGPSSLLFSLPLAIFLVLSVIFLRVKEELFEVDTIKSISAQLFRKKIEANLEDTQINDKNEIEPRYVESFLPVSLNSKDFFVEQSSPLKKIEEVIHKWVLGNSDEKSLAVYGEQGVGKSTVLNLISSDCQVIRVSLSKKITSQSDLITFLKEECLLDFSEEEDMTDTLHLIDSGLTEKRVIIIDNAHNLFLSHRKGFEAYRCFTSLITLKTHNIFWCMSFNYYSWMYLNAISNGSQFFRKVIKIESWDDEAVKELIQSRHDKTGFGLEFNPVIYSVSAGNSHETFQYIQDRFFELLWEQSKGNPRTALALWISSLTSLSAKKLCVGLPGASLPQKIEGMNEEELFVIASVVRHESLNTTSATLVTGLDENIVQHAMRVGVERGFLQRDEKGVYRLTPIWQPVVIRELKSKNLIYG